MTAPRRFRWTQAACLALASLVCACGSSKPKLSAQGVTHTANPAGKGSSDSLRGRPELESYLVATVPERTLGPFLARRDGTAMVGYISTEGAARKVVAAPISAANGKPSANARVVATAGGDVDMLVVRPTGGARPGYVALWTSLTDRGKAIQLVGIADDGNARGQVIEVARTTDNVVWVEVVPTPRGAICVWAEETRDSSANILGVPLDSDGRPRGVPTPLARGVIGWQAVATTMGAGLALVSREAGQKPSLLWTKLDGDARAVGAPEVIAARSFVGTDVDVVRVGDAWVFAWTDRSGFDPQIMTVSLDERATSKEKVRAPVPAVTAIGGAKLVGLVSFGDAAALAWDESGRTGRSGRLHVTKMDAGGKLAPDASVTLELEGNTVPILAPAGRGVGLLVNARACPLASNADACAAVSPGPTFLRLDEKFAAVQVESMRLREQREATLAWGLDCGGKEAHEARECLALAALPLPEGAPGVSQVHAAHMPARPSLYKAPLVPPLPPDAPRPLTLTTVAARETFTDLAAAHVGDGTLLALVSSPPATDKRDGPRKPTASKQAPPPPAPLATGDAIRVYDLDAKGALRDKPALLTNRALSVGGVAIASDGNDGAAVAWVARDGGDPQVHLARVDRHGKKLREQQVTSDRGDASDVAVGWVKNGWIVAWVDGKDGNGEVYAARVSPELRVSPPERVTRAPGDASDLSLLVQGDRVWLAFSDPRDSPHDGFADVYVATLRASDAKRTSEVRVLATAAHSRSPVLAAAGDGVAVGWIEEAPMGTEPNNSAAYGAMVAWLDASGQPVREPVRTAGMGSGFPTAIAFQNAPGQGSLRAILARSTRDELSLDAVELPPTPATPAASVRVFPLLALSGPPSQDISLSFLEGALFYSDGLPEEERVRRLTIGWK
ncbi:hypothetical protein LVJ94_44590 [Pendulispora rubella]|uniref:Lipoprotein LpqB beta-propeller domain-containing protein n=1 Tax=Pendulispora rubella TaxID=2741070 RepID=A0ABZ2L442_9BACT